MLLTHAPPRGVGDGEDAVHRGFTALHGLVSVLAPTVLLHGSDEIVERLRNAIR